MLVGALTAGKLAVDNERLRVSAVPAVGKSADEFVKVKVAIVCFLC